MHATCGIWMSSRNEECGLPAVADITMKNRIFTVHVAVCSGHKSEHDRAFAAQRSNKPKGEAR